MAGGHRRLSGNKKAHVDAVRNDINVTPLVDVMLVLLIIFMLMTLIMGRGHDVTLPKAQYYSQEKDKMQPVVTIDAEANLFVEKNKLGPINESTLKEMGDQIQAAWKAPKNPDGVGRVYIKADTKLEYSKVFPVLKYLNQELAVLRSLGQPVALATSSTDANVPMARGIPAITIGGGGRGSAAHSLEESFDPAGGANGLRQAILLAVTLAQP